MENMIKNKKKYEILAEKIAEMDYGDTVLHSEIVAIIDVPYPSQKYNSIVQQAKKILLNDYSRYIECVKGAGYRISYPDDFTKVSQKYVKRGVNAIKKSETILTNAPVNEMTEEGRTAYRRVHDRVVILNAAVQGANIEVKMLGKKRHPLALQGTK